MDIEKKIELNKKIRSYDDTNSFMISLKKHLRSNKYLTRVDYKGRKLKILSDKQYEVAERILEQTKSDNQS